MPAPVAADPELIDAHTFRRPSRAVFPSRGKAGHVHAEATRIIDITAAAEGSAGYVLGSQEFEVEIRAVSRASCVPLTFKSVRVLTQ